MQHGTGALAVAHADLVEDEAVVGDPVLDPALHGRGHIDQPLAPGAARCLRRLRDRHVLLGLASNDQAYTLRELGAALRAGPHGLLKKGRAGLTLRKVERAVHGLDLGPLVRQLPGRLMTPDSRVNLAHPVVLADWPRVLAGLREAETAVADPEFDLLMVGRRHLRSNTRWMHNLPSLMRGRPRCTLEVHPDDAAVAGLTTGDLASVTAAGGASITVPVEVTDAVRRRS